MIITRVGPKVSHAITTVSKDLIGNISTFGIIKQLRFIEFL